METLVHRLCPVCGLYAHCCWLINISNIPMKGIQTQSLLFNPETKMVQIFPKVSNGAAGKAGKMEVASLMKQERSSSEHKTEWMNE